LPAEAPLDERWVAVHLLGEIGKADSLPGIFRIFDTVDRVHLQRPFVRETLEAAIAAIVARDPGSHAVLRAQLDALDPAFLPSLASALGREGSVPSFRLLVDLVGRSPSLDERVLQALSKPDLRQREALLSTCVPVLRRSLESSDPQVARLAVHGLGRWRDEGSLADMIELLESADAGAARVLQSALQEISGITTRWDCASWRSWFSDQQSWHRDALEGTLDALASEEPARVITALRELSERRLYHREIAPRIAPLLGDESSATAAAACAALERLGDAGSLPALIEALDDERDQVRLAAHRALRAIAGCDLSAESGAWRVWLGS